MGVIIQISHCQCWVRERSCCINKAKQLNYANKSINNLSNNNNVTTRQMQRLENQVRVSAL